MKNLVKYIFIGSLGVSCDFLLYSLLISINLNYIFSNCLGYFFGTLISFSLNRLYNFKVFDNTLKRFTLFFGAAFAGLLLSSFILYFLIEINQINAIIAKLFVIPVIVLLQYSINSKVTFKQ